MGNKNKMTATNKRILAGIGLIAVAGIIIYLRRRNKENIINELKAEQVSEHGYETAHDILFPNKNKRSRRHRHNQG
jgi:hypothetical protein